MADSNNMSYEHAISQLEEIVKQLESGDLDLETSLKMFETGIEMTRISQAKLQEAEQKVKILMEKHGQLELQPFTENSDLN